MQTSNDPGIQQMCAVLTRKKIVGHWGELSSAVKEGIQQLIFDILMKDQARYDSKLRFSSSVSLYLTAFAYSNLRVVFLGEYADVWRTWQQL